MSQQTDSGLELSQTSNVLSPAVFLNKYLFFSLLKVSFCLASSSPKPCQWKPCIFRSVSSYMQYQQGQRSCFAVISSPVGKEELHRMSACSWPGRAVLEQHFKEAAQREIHSQLTVGAPVIHRAPAGAGDSGVARAVRGGSVWGIWL